MGDYFASCLRADIEGLRVTAGIHRVVYRDYHRLLSRVFPYGIFYTHQNDDIVIWAIIDLRKEPAWIRERLGE
ncbi:MAG: type II toxin-antitoxin system RelE/ParE family toxin [Verrucomicrobiae bacterium]|nr:type II toxin-antitoxin system RelE/ParE family toxin [Verrucomicrobiae bacterium]